MPKQILLIDDQTLITEGIKEEIERQNSSKIIIDVANKFYEAIDLLEKTSYDVICLDLNMPSIRGQACFNELNGTTLNGWLFLKHYIFSKDAKYYEKCKNSKIFIFSGYIDELKNHIKALDIKRTEEKMWFVKLNLISKGLGDYDSLVQNILKQLG